jgi:hypothetical protein
MRSDVLQNGKDLGKETWDCGVPERQDGCPARRVAQIDDSADPPSLFGSSLGNIILRRVAQLDLPQGGPVILVQALCLAAAVLQRQTSLLPCGRLNRLAQLPHEMLR